MAKVWIKWTVAAAGAAFIASCASPPPRVVQAPPPPPVPQELPYKWTHGNAPKAHKDSVQEFGAVALAPGQYRWVADMPEAGDANIIIDLLTQRFYVYRGERLVGMSTMSSGKKGKETPLGFWAVRTKKVKGFSRKYDNAPMPYMQMYDEKGIAFHAGNLPGYPASHGCVRLPLKFAERLYGMTKIGTKVTVEG